MENRHPNCQFDQLDEEYYIANSGLEFMGTGES